MELDDLEDENELEATIARTWQCLYYFYKGTRCGKSEDYRKFKAWVGCSPDVCEFIFRKYQNDVYLPSRKFLLIVLNFLKNMPSQDEGAASFKISRPTYRKYLWSTLLYLDRTMTEVQSLSFSFLIDSDNTC